MLRKIEYQGDFPEMENHIQFSVIEVQTKEVVNDEFTEPEEYNVAYLDVAETYQAIVDYETIISYDEEGNEVEVQNSNLRDIHSRHGFILPSCYMG